MNIFIDIETLPTIDPAIIAELHDTIKAPGNYKKPETIAEWMATEGEKAKADAVAKTSFDGLYGRICCVCFAIDDGPIEACATNNEFQLLTELFGLLQESAHDQATYVGHNLVGFDLPFLKHRSIIHGIKPPLSLAKVMSAMAWSDGVADTMLMWSPDRDKRVSMDKLCRALGIPGKGDFDGSMVAATWPTDPQKVIDYCMGDIERTRAIYKRLVWENAA